MKKRAKGQRMPTLAADLVLTEDKDTTRASTYPGQAHFAQSGWHTCRLCRFWDFADNAGRGVYGVGSGMIKDSYCRKAQALAMRKDLPRVPHYALSCKFFDANPDAPPAFKERKHGG